MPPSRRSLCLVALGCVGLGACAADASTTALGASGTEVVVAPEDFVRGATCSAVPGGLQSYVVTLRAYDDVSDTVPFTLPSSQPTPCSLSFVMRDLVVGGKLYAADIDGYDVPATALTPFGGESSGSRTMLDAEGLVVAPRWTSNCGGGATTATRAEPNQSNVVENCTSLVDKVGSPTEIRLAADAILSADACVLTNKIALRSLEGSLALPPELACDAPSFAVPGEAGAPYRFYARARRADGSDIGTECSGTFVAGQSLSPACDIPSSFGSVALAPSTLQDGGVAACPKGAAYAVLVNGVQLDPTRTPCEQPSQIGPLPAGIVDLAIVTYDALGAPTAGGATCKADVEPGRVVDAICL